MHVRAAILAAMILAIPVASAAAPVRGYIQRPNGFDLNANGIQGEIGVDDTVCDGNPNSQVDELYVDCDSPVNGNGTPGSPYNSITAAVNAANGPNVGQEDAVCIRGTCGTSPGGTETWPIMISSGGKSTMFTRALRNSEYFAGHEYPAEPFRLTCWDTDNDGDYVTDETCIVDPGTGVAAYALRTNASYVEVSHITWKNFGRGTSVNGRGFYKGNRDNTHVWLHDLQIVDINRGVSAIGASDTRIISTIGLGGVDHFAFENSSVSGYGGYMLRGSCPADQQNSCEYMRFANLTTECFGADGAKCNVADIWGDLTQLQFVDSIFMSNGGAWGGSANSAISVNACANTWRQRNNLFVGWQTASNIEANDFGNNCPLLMRPTDDVIIDGNEYVLDPTEDGKAIFGALYIQSGDSGGTQYESVKNLRFSNNLIRCLAPSSGIRSAINIVNQHDDGGNCPGASGSGTVGIYNNTFAGCENLSDGIYRFGGASGSGSATDLACSVNNLVVKNNIVTDIAGGPMVLFHDLTGLTAGTWADNVWDSDGTWKYKSQPVRTSLVGWVADSGETTPEECTPYFLCAGSNPTCQPVMQGMGDYHLSTQDTCAKDKAETLDSIFTTDHDQNARVVPWDRGAFTAGGVAGSFCGDGVVDMGEECDNGASNSNTTPDACRMNCMLPSCGDSVTDSGESCDPGADDPDDCCTGLCAFESALTTCGEAEECTNAATCTGSSATCPAGTNKADGTACSTDGNVCTDDECMSGVCAHLANTDSCDDGLFCNGTDTCSAKVCTHQYVGNARCTDPEFPLCNESTDMCVASGECEWGTLIDLTGGTNTGPTTSGIRNIRNVIEANIAGATNASKLRITTGGAPSGSNGCEVTEARVGHCDDSDCGGAETVCGEFDTAPTAITWGGGNPGVSISPMTTTISDEIDFAYDATKPLCIHYYLSNRACAQYNDGRARANKTGTPSEADTLDNNWVTSWSTESYAWVKLESCVEPTAPICGNMVLDAGEECDDGNTTPGDCCDQLCQYEEIATPCTSDSNDCTVDTCDAAGTCLHLPVVEGTACEDDGLECTFDQCDDMGTCQHPDKPTGTPCLDDGNDCTDDECAAGGFCNHFFNNDPCDDGLFCNGADFCLTGSCNVHIGNPCLPLVLSGTECKRSCDEASDECTANDPAGSVCEDGLFCTGGPQRDTCDGAGNCLPGDDPCPGADGDEFCSESCDEVFNSCTGPDPDSSACLTDGELCTDDICVGGQCTHPWDQSNDASCPAEPSNTGPFYGCVCYGCRTRP